MILHFPATFDKVRQFHQCRFVATLLLLVSRGRDAPSQLHGITVKVGKQASLAAERGEPPPQGVHLPHGAWIGLHIVSFRRPDDISCMLQRMYRSPFGISAWSNSGQTAVIYSVFCTP